MIKQGQASTRTVITLGARVERTNRGERTARQRRSASMPALSRRPQRPERQPSHLLEAASRRPFSWRRGAGCPASHRARAPSRLRPGPQPAGAHRPDAHSAVSSADGLMSGTWITRSGTCRFRNNLRALSRYPSFAYRNILYGISPNCIIRIPSFGDQSVLPTRATTGLVGSVERYSVHADLHPRVLEGRPVAGRPAG